MVRKSLPLEDVLDAVKKAGEELAKTGDMSEENLKTASRELVSLESRWI